MYSESMNSIRKEQGSNKNYLTPVIGHLPNHQVSLHHHPILRSNFCFSRHPTAAFDLKSQNRCCTQFCVRYQKRQSSLSRWPVLLYLESWLALFGSGSHYPTKPLIDSNLDQLVQYSPPFLDYANFKHRPSRRNLPLNLQLLGVRLHTRPHLLLTYRTTLELIKLQGFPLNFRTYCQ